MNAGFKYLDHDSIGRGDNLFYIGKNGKDYDSLEALKIANEEYHKMMYPERVDKMMYPERVDKYRGLVDGILDDKTQKQSGPVHELSELELLLNISTYLEKPKEPEFITSLHNRLENHITSFDSFSAERQYSFLLLKKDYQAAISLCDLMLRFGPDANNMLFDSGLWINKKEEVIGLLAEDLFEKCMKDEDYPSAKAICEIMLKRKTQKSGIGELNKNFIYFNQEKPKPNIWEIRLKDVMEKGAEVLYRILIKQNKFSEAISFCYEMNERVTREARNNMDARGMNFIENDVSTLWSSRMEELTRLISDQKDKTS